jgi:hypothetical protein
MATEEIVDTDETAEDLPDPDEEILEDDAIEDSLDAVDDDIAVTESDDSDSDDKDEDADEAFDELEAEELEMLTEDETTETLVVDEAAEMRAIRRAELAMDQQGVVEATEGEFVCSSCFLVLKSVQLANPRKKICKDCAS